MTRQDDALEDLPAVGAERRRGLLELRLEILSTGCTVRTTNGSPMKTSAMKMPSGVNATLMPSGASRLPSQPFSA